MTGTLEEIVALNYAWLLLARRLSSEDRLAAMRLLGLSSAVSETLVSLTDEKIVDLSRSNQLLCRLRLDDHTLLTALEDKGAKTPLVLEQTDDIHRGEP
jgi:flagellar transcriptional activator FlhD